MAGTGEGGHALGRAGAEGGKPRVGRAATGKGGRSSAEAGRQGWEREWRWRVRRETKRSGGGGR